MENEREYEEVETRISSGWWGIDANKQNETAKSEDLKATQRVVARKEDWMGWRSSLTRLFVFWQVVCYDGQKYNRKQFSKEILAFSHASSEYTESIDVHLVPLSN